jgi:hypothetical protein
VTAGRVAVAWDGQAGRWRVEITPPGGGGPVAHPMAAHVDATGATWPMPDPATRPPAGDAASWDRPAEEFVKLADAVARRNATVEQAVAYGRHLFDALFGPAGWAALDLQPPGRPAGEPLVVLLEWDASPLHRFVWELLHDGTGYLALRAGSPAVFLRLAGPPGAAAPATIARPPRVLFAVGSALSDQRVRAGAEVMGVLRDIERGRGVRGTAVQARVLTSASLTRLGTECERLTPDVVHLIGHGRWDAQAGVGRLTLADDAGGGEEEHTAAELAAKLSTPTLVVVSACESGYASTEAGLPLGAELAAAGVPIVVAMAGAISDTACRVFTRSVVAAVARGVGFTTALAIGRRAAFAYAQNTPVKVDWALPAVFTRAALDATFILTDPVAVGAVREVIEGHGHVALPLFAGRHELFDDLDALLGPGQPGTLVLHSSYPRQIGGTRALQELAAEAVRLGHLPVRVGPFTCADAPATVEALAYVVGLQMVRVADLEGVAPPRQTLELAAADPLAAAAAPLDDLLVLDRSALPPRSDRSLVRALRADLFALRDAVAAARPGVFAATAAPLLLLDDIHLCLDGLARLLALLSARGLGDAPQTLPVVVFGKEHAGEGALLERERARGGRHGPLRFRELKPVGRLDGGADRLAFLSWMLNPPSGVAGWPDAVLAPDEAWPDPEQWVETFREFMWDCSFYDPVAHQRFARYGLRFKLVVTGDDDAVLQAYGMLP